MKADSYPSDFKPNFSCEYSVTISHPLSTTFPVLGTDQGLERVISLSSLASDFVALDKDNVAVDGKLFDASVRTAPSSDSGFPRQAFRFKESFKILPGLNLHVGLQGTFTWDDEQNVALYETLTDKGITIRKLRWLEALDDGATRVNERIEGQCSWLLQGITQKMARDGHKAHMDSYHTLF
ncbi:hypothetical protein FB45DRAFT_923353 [Roridomyces roridus]|uniref:Uncharacterized protein n=1 Tax=Roridomyces roridus TaxID=1738132 RepID=A0AAD7FH99_9AGAR|nr:hypothetical protein FB45DRAFT_923353 [Roridomyces roridus]